MGLIEFCLEGLERAYLPQFSRYAFAFHPEQGCLDGDPRLACKYTLNTLLGLSRAGRAGSVHGFDLKAMYERTCAELYTLRPEPADVAIAMWAAGELGFDPPSWVVSRFDRDLSALDWSHMQDLAWLLYAACVMHRAGEKRWNERVHRLARTMRQEFQIPRTGLFLFRRTGIRRHFASFAVPVYANLALHEYAVTFGDESAARAAAHGIRALLALQGPHGQWAWFHDVTSGRVLDWYRVYGVHQDAMAPMVLLRGIELGVEGSREALVKGFRWILGENELSTCMVDREAKLVYRSVGRIGRLERPRRLAAAHWKRWTGSEGRRAGRTELSIDRQCRSYHLGWVLWTFAGRDDFDELKQHAIFEAK
jgi:hypothetical protein